MNLTGKHINVTYGSLLTLGASSIESGGPLISVEDGYGQPTSIQIGPSGNGINVLGDIYMNGEPFTINMSAGSFYDVGDGVAVKFKIPHNFTQGGVPAVPTSVQLTPSTGIATKIPNYVYSLDEYNITMMFVESPPVDEAVGWYFLAV